MGFRDYNLCKAKPQLGIMPRVYYTAFLYTDTPIGEAKTEETQSAKSPSPLVRGRSTKRCTLCKFIQYFLPFGGVKDFVRVK